MDTNMKKKGKLLTNSSSSLQSKKRKAEELLSTGDNATENPDERVKKILLARQLVAERDQARANNDFIKSDNIRDKLSDMGVFVQDQKGGPSGWRFTDNSSKKLPPGYKLAEEHIHSKPSLSLSVSPSPSESKSNEKKKKKKESGAERERERNMKALSSVLPNKVDTKEINTPRIFQGVTITDARIGGGKEVKSGQKVSVSYIGKLKSNNIVFDSSKRPFSFRLGRGEVIRGWDIGVVGMREGGKRRLQIPPEKAYGKTGAPPSIPGNAALLFDITLL
eukprot:CAMPEP_0182421208 /NCGR_PEP_ID=MMETSP1167-20130531/6484_1 /TAXON_ID=2988 /ORGANISM="Mallomonas Sp, Strain CCMP3275" /LENGTH=277 /DNA_ID=CAMNT_0024598099 /DNA_START=106 /DNA_END=936 /DNA_ORIENTATION=-